MLWGIEIAANIDPSETYREIRTARKKIPMPTKRSTVASEAKIPIPVAIPFPPLKLAKTDQTCPSTAVMPAINCTSVKSSKGVRLLKGKFP